MRKIVCFALCLTLAVPAVVLTDDTSDDPLAKQAGQLVDGKTSRVEKLIAVHGFVRDQISETKTKYG
jgi:hypothetical protein